MGVESSRPRVRYKALASRITREQATGVQATHQAKRRRNEGGDMKPRLPQSVHG